MKGKWIALGTAALGLALIAVGCAQATTEPPAPTEPQVPVEPPEPTEIVLTGSATKGGKLYDKWWSAAEVDEPTSEQPLWATQDTNTRSGGDTWRCKECHGWDYQGAEGAYGSGSHFTGFPGVIVGAPGMSHGELLAWLDGTTNADHDFSAMGQEPMADLVIFLSEGLIDVAPFIDAETKAAVGGDETHGEELYASVCAACHGMDGRTINFHDPDDPEFVGNIAVDNPWEFIHKVRTGQPGAPMPAGIDNGWSMQDVVDVLAYSQTLPTEPPSTASVSDGGKLYDKWWVVAEVDEPSEDNPVWARQDTNTRSGGDTWRCKECHGWDYQGAEGAYGSGSHFTGFPGLLAAAEKAIEDLMAQLTGQVDPDHDFSAMGEAQLATLIQFLKEGLVDVAPFIDAETKAAVGGDAANGEVLYMSTCTACHGEDGTTINFHDPDDPEFVGNIAIDNPWEFIHKVRAGQPGTGMPAGIDNDWTMQEVIDLLTFAQTLPTEAP
jgi:thiosulfate dehydrogenase